MTADIWPDGDSVDPDWIALQRRQGWPHLHPEHYCHQCGRRNIRWFSPEWGMLDPPFGILCPSCFGRLDMDAVWCLTRIPRGGEKAERTDELASFLREVSTLGAEPSCGDWKDEAQRVASCLVDYLSAKERAS